MSNVFDRYGTISAGLKALLRESQSYTDQIPLKLRAMQDIYLKQNPHLYDPSQVQKLQYYQEAFSYKDLEVTLLLEQLWSLVHTGTGDRALVNVLENIYDVHDTTDEQLMLFSFVVDNFLLQATAFLDFYMLYLCTFFHVEETKYLSGDKLIHALGKVEAPSLKEKARHVKEFFDDRVFGETRRETISVRNWGGLLRDLRNSAVHRDIEYPSFDVGEKLVEKKTQDWPAELQGIETARFAQDVQNDMFTMVSTLAATLYDLEWEPGPYRADLWQA